MSIDDDYFDLEQAIEDGEFSEDNARLISRILQALTDHEKLTMALQDKIRLMETQTNAELYNKAELEHEIKVLKRKLKVLKQIEIEKLKLELN